MRLAARLLLMSAACAGPTAAAQQPKPKEKAPDGPVPLLKAVTPPAGGVRVRVPAAEGKLNDFHSTYHLAGEVPKARKKKTDKAETVPVTVAFDTAAHPGSVAEAKWKSWGYEVPKDGVGVLPELILPASQVAPKAAKGADVRVRIPNVRLQVVRTRDDAETIYGCDLYLSVAVLEQVADRGVEPRVYFPDKLVEFTAPAALARPGGDAPTPPDPKVADDPTLVPAATPGPDPKAPGPPFLSLNGKSRYKTPAGVEVPVVYGVSSTLNWRQGIVMTVGTARGCGVEFDEGKSLGSVGETAIKGTMHPGTAKEFRLAVATGPGLKAPQDFVLKDVPVVVDATDSGHRVWLGAKFVEEHFKDGVYAAGPDGQWRLYGRVRPDRLIDPKTRAADPKPPAKKP